jgi:glutathionyl-hydroquinone reductase
LAARRTTWLLSAAPTGIKCQFLNIQIDKFMEDFFHLISNIYRIGAAMHLRNQEWDNDWLYEFLPRYEAVLPSD